MVLDGDWQIGHVPAKNYAIKAQQAAKMMKDVDSLIYYVVHQIQKYLHIHSGITMF